MNVGYGILSFVCNIFWDYNTTVFGEQFLKFEISFEFCFVIRQFESVTLC